MKKIKSTKSALLTSALALLLCMSMLIGTTFAWFTDSVTSGSNVMKAGNLDIDVQYTLDGKNWNDLNGATDLFQKGLWEPGHTEVVALKITNKGSLALKYAANMNIIDESIGKTMDGKDIILSDILTVSTLIQQANAFGDIALGLAFAGENKIAYETTSAFKAANVLGTEKELHVGASHYLFVKVDMAETVGNEANHDGNNVPEINFGINVLATQFTTEYDSFDNQYDKDADFVSYFTSGTHTVNTTLMATKATDVITVTGTDTIVNITGGYYDAGDQDCAVWAKDGATVNIYDGTFIHNGSDEAATSAHHYDMIYAGANGGKINVYGGHYSARNNGVWLLNEKDNQGEIVVYGGTFVNWNPADNESEGQNTTFVADGYEVTTQYKANGDVWYEVKESGGGIINEKGASVELSDTTINSEEAGLENYGTATLNNVTMKAGSTADYSNIAHAGSTTTYNNVDIDSAGGGVGAVDGAKVVFNSGSVAVNSASTSGRYNFYAVGEGTVITINEGEFSFSKTLNQKRAYIYAGNGATVYVNGGTFGKASTRSGYTAGILGDGTVIITGGTFGFNPTTWVAEGYTASESSGTWTVTAAN